MIEGYAVAMLELRDSPLFGAKQVNAAQVHLPPAAVGEERNLQYFFPFPWQDKEEEVLKEEEAADLKDDFPNENPDERLGCCYW